MESRGCPKVGYLTSRYPTVSHAFILREVTAVRAAGGDVVTYSVRRTPPEEVLSPADEEALATTFAILPRPARALLADHVAALRAAPRAYLQTLRLALQMAPPGPRGLLWQLFYFLESMVLWRRARADGVTHLHAQFANVATDVALLCAHFGRRAGSGPRTWSLAVHGSAEFFDVTLFRLAEKLRRADFVTAISEFGRSQLMAQVSEDVWPRIAVVRCGVDPDAFAPRPANGRVDPTIRVLSVGRLMPLKGQPVMLEAIAALRARGLDARLTLVGDGPSRDSLEKLARKLGIADTVTFAGSVGQDKIRDYFDAADVFCLSSFAEGLPVVLMEAMAMELPVVAPRITGIPELVEHARSGLLVTPGRPDELADALASLAAEPGLRRRLGAAGREKVLAGFDVRESGIKLARLFQEKLAA